MEEPAERIGARRYDRTEWRSRRRLKSKCRKRRWRARRACPGLTISTTSAVQQAQKRPLARKDNFPNCPARGEPRRIAAFAPAAQQCARQSKEAKRLLTCKDNFQNCPACQKRRVPTRLSKALFEAAKRAAERENIALSTYAVGASAAGERSRHAAMQAQNIIGGRSWPTLKKREAGATNAGRSRTSKHCTVENIHIV